MHTDTYEESAIRSDSEELSVKNRMSYSLTYDTGTLALQLDCAMTNGCFKSDTPIGFNAYKGTGFALDSCAPVSGRFHVLGQPSYYWGSGEQCCRYECRMNVSGKALCELTPHPISYFDLPEFTRRFHLGNLFLQDIASGGYGPCHFVKNYLYERYGVTGILYQSYQLYVHGVTGYCLNITPLSGQYLPTGHYQPPSGYVATTSGLYQTPNYNGLGSFIV